MWPCLNPCLQSLLQLMYKKSIWKNFDNRHSPRPFHIYFQQGIFLVFIFDQKQNLRAISLTQSYSLCTKMGMQKNQLDPLLGSRVIKHFRMPIYGHMSIYGHTNMLNYSAPEQDIKLNFSTPPYSYIQNTTTIARTLRKFVF